MDKWQQSIYTDGTSNFLSPSQPKIKHNITISLRVFKNNPLREIYLRIAPDGEQILIPMEETKQDHIFSWYKVAVNLTVPLLLYRFKLVTDDDVYWYNAQGMYHYTPTDHRDFRLVANFKVPEWLSKRVFYQVFPDRFYNGDANINPQSDSYSYLGNAPILRKWHEKPGEYYETHSMDFFGGDLKGVQQKIPHLKELGVNAIYLNPIFHSPSNHRYDVQDYFKVDPHLGTNQDFADLIKKLHAKGIRIILDGVFNHTGISCQWFNKTGVYKKPGAYQSRNSPYISFYDFIDYPNKYYSWCGLSTLPKLNFRSQKLRAMIYGEKKSVMQYWLEAPYHMDGWRLDVANMLARQGEYQDYQSIFREMRNIIKHNYPEAYLLGEHFFDASELLQGDMLDASMNYLGFTLPLREWLTQKTSKGEKIKFSTEDLHRQLQDVRSLLSWQIAVVQYNCLNSHDLTRLSYLTKNVKLDKLAALFLMTYIGIPAIYYGEEIGLMGGKSVESARTPMVWEQSQWNMDLYKWYQSLIQLRKESIALQKGGIKTLWNKDNIYCYARFYNKEIKLAVLNRSKKEEICVIDVALVGVTSGSFICWQTGKEYKVQNDHTVAISVPAHTGLVLVF